jgi:phage-related protein
MIVLLVTSLASFIILNLPILVDAALKIVIALATGLSESLPELIPAIVNAVILIVETLLDNIDLLIDAAISIVMALAEGLIIALPILIDKIPVIIDKLILALVNNLSKLIEMGIILIVKLSIGIIKAIPKLLGAIPQIISSLVTGFATHVNKMSDVGKNLVIGLWNGIKNMGKWISDKISGFSGDILGGIKKFFGIHSPSTVMEDQIGKNLGLGIATGITKTEKKISESLRDAIPSQIETKYNYMLNRGNSEGIAKRQSLSNTNYEPFILKIENFYNNIPGDIKRIFQEAEFYRRQILTSRGG